MAHPEGMHTLAARIASFEPVKPKGKKRASNAKNKKGISAWALQKPDVEQLSQAGFYFNPTAKSSDNVTCFHCSNSLDEWEEGDDAFREHLQFAPSCGWAITMAVEQGILEQDEEHDPLSEYFVEARKETFGLAWPHECKKGWLPKVQKLAEAGWYYFPSGESDDYTKCVYCGLCLDGWEQKDKPIDEHRRRAPDCIFFVLSDKHKKQRKSSKGRQTKASRMSTQSIATLTQEKSAFEEDENLEDSIMTTATDTTAASISSTVSGKAGRSKKSSTKAAPRMTRGRKRNQETMEIDAQYEGQNVEAAALLSSPETDVKSRKRNSHEIQEDEPDDEATSATRKRLRTTKEGTTGMKIGHDMSSEANALVNQPDVSAEPKKTAKGRAKGGSVVPRNGSRAASGTRKAAGRKASAASTAPKASLRAASSDNEEIEAMLEADLDRPMSDVEMEALPTETSTLEPQTRTNTHSKKTAIAPTHDQSLIQVDTAAQDTSVLSEEALESRVSYALEDTTSAKNLFSNPYSDLVKAAGGSDRLSESSIASKSKTSSQSKRKPPVAKSKGSRTGKKGLVKAEEPNSNNEVPVPEEMTEAKRFSMENQGEELRFSSSFEEVASMLDTAEVPDEVLQSYSPKKLASKPLAKPSKAAISKPTKSGKGRGAKVENASLLSELSQPEKSATIAVKNKAGKQAESEQERKEDRGSPGSTFVKQPSSDHSAPQQVQSPTHTAPGAFPSPTPSPQSSDAENAPPSSRPSVKRPPLAPLTPGQGKCAVSMVPVASAATATPTRSIKRSRSDNGVSPQWTLESSYPWRPIDIEAVFLPSPSATRVKWFDAQVEENKENTGLFKEEKRDALARLRMLLSTDEQNMTVEEWIKHNAEKGEEKLRNECERVVGQFESEGVKALKALEGITVVDE